MANELIINASLPETRIALTEDGEIQELLLERASGKGITGNIYKGRVTRVLPGMQAAFVDIGLEKAAFLYVDDVYVHGDYFAEEEGEEENTSENEEGGGEETRQASSEENAESSETAEAGTQESVSTPETVSDAEAIAEAEEQLEGEEGFDEDGDSEDDDGPVGMDREPEDEQPEGTVSPDSGNDGDEGGDEEGGSEEGEAEGTAAAGAEGSASEEGRPGRRRRRGRRGGKNRRRDGEAAAPQGGVGVVRPRNAAAPAGGPAALDEHSEQLQGAVTDADVHEDGGERPSIEEHAGADAISERPGAAASGQAGRHPQAGGPQGSRNRRNLPEFKESRGRDRRVRAKTSLKPQRGQVNIQDLLKEGDEVLVQVAKDPIATKGARLTCHISLPGRHLVCMPTIDHVGVSRRIERDDERRRLRDFVERARPKKLGFIVRTASGKSQQSEKRLKQDVDYLSRLWDEIRDRASQVSAPALVYEDLNSVLRAIRDWVTEDIDKIIVDSRYHHQEILKFVSHFMPAIRGKVELYHGDIPIFDAYGISSELSRAMERRVWLKSGGYIVVDQAEALVAIDVNTGRYVGKRNLEDTILKTNLEAVKEIAYQLRLRNCGGIIILDLIDMEKDENKQRVYRALEEELRKDRSRPSILKISELGLVEMTRKRTRDTVIRMLCEPCNHCEGKGFIKSKQTVAYEIMRELEREGIERQTTKILVRAHSEVIDILAIDERETLDALEKRYRKQIFLQAINDFHQEQFEVLGDVKLQQQEAREAEKQRDRDHAQRNRGPREGGRDQQRRDTREAGEGGGQQNQDSQEGGSGDRGGRDGGRRGGRGRDRPRDRNDRSNRGPRIEGAGGGGLPVPLAIPIPREAPQADEGAVDAQDEDRQPQFRITPNVIPASMGGDENAGNNENGQPYVPSNDPFEEEDRLAFLRAQAAQDAALAMYGRDGNGNAAPNGNGGQPGGRPGGGGRPRWGGGKKPSGGGGGGAGGGTGGGGRRGGRNRNRPRSGRPFEARGGGGAGGGNGGGPGDIPNG